MLLCDVSMQMWRQEALGSCKLSRKCHSRGWCSSRDGRHSCPPTFAWVMAVCGQWVSWLRTFSKPQSSWSLLQFWSHSSTESRLCNDASSSQQEQLPAPAFSLSYLIISCPRDGLCHTVIRQQASLNRNLDSIAAVRIHNALAATC